VDRVGLCLNLYSCPHTTCCALFWYADSFILSKPERPVGGTESAADRHINKSRLSPFFDDRQRDYDGGLPRKSNVDGREPPRSPHIQYHCCCRIRSSLFHHPSCGELETSSRKARKTQRRRRKKGRRM
jgi:hypothetical protein